MRRHRSRAFAAVVGTLAVVAAGLVAVTGPAQAAAPGNGPAKAIHGTLQKGRLSVVDLCAATASANQARCYAKRVDGPRSIGVQPHADAPNGYSPADLVSAYHLPTDGGAGATIAIIDAYDNPNALADLTVYREQFGLPALTPGQFRKVNQRGVEGSYPEPDEGWAGEIALDIDMVSAIAPRANILLVEADSNSLDDLGASVNQAVDMGATYVSNSYGTGYTSTPGSGEDPSDPQTSDLYYNHPGVAVVASSGDDDTGVSFPASSPVVTSVGGTSLVRAGGTTRGWSESVWSNQYGGPGSGCSLYEEKPAFQTDTGCDKRTVADVSAVSDPATGVAVYNTYGDDGWAQYGGTSAASPIIASVYALGGPVPAGTAPVSFPYAKTSALNDVTTGDNGSCDPDYLCTAGAGYDGPTGLGTPDGVAAFSTGPHGVVAGTVTDTATGDPVGGATVSAGDASATTDADGTYRLTVEPGSYTLTVTAFGYATKSVTGVTVADGETVTRNVALTAVPSVNLSGTVTDGSGHAWPLYARISIDGKPGAPVYTDPITGHYSIDLPRRATYTLHVDANYPGYLSTTSTVKVGSADLTKAVKVKADLYAGTAPGYRKTISGPTTTFDSTTAPPAGWTVTNATDDGGWEFDDPGKRGNLTGGSGGFAIVDSDALGPGLSQDSVLTAPAVDFTGKNDPVVAFDTDYRSYSDQTGDVDYSVDGGTTWLNAWHAESNVTGPQQVKLPAAAGKADVLVRFHFVGTFGFWWQVDNVRIGNATLARTAGGLIAGNVTDKNTGEGVNGGTVTNASTSGESASTGATPDDPNLGDGFYWFFATGSGNRHLTAAKAKYSPASRDVDLTKNYVTKADFVLPAGQVSTTSTGITKTVKWQGTATGSVELTNTGTAPATVTVGEKPGGSVIAAARGATVHRVNAKTSIHRAVVKGAKKSVRKAAPDVNPQDDPWTSVTDLPVATQDNVAGVSDGILYSAFGYTGEEDTSDLYAYDPSTGGWTKKAAASATREAPAHGFVDGKWYISGGWGATGDPEESTEIYDPDTDSWNNGADNPTPLAGSGSAVLDGKLYVVGGCTGDACGTTDVQVYDPDADSWSSAADYPEPVSWEACGGIAGTLYCAGGVTDDGSITDAYAYDPGADAWNPIAEMPADVWGSAYAAANGQLLVSGGVIDSIQEITNEGWAYDPTTDAWSSLPNSNTASYRGGAALGFYKVGGSPGGAFAPPLATVEVLPGFDQGGASDVSWLSESPTTVTLAPGASATVAVTLTADVPEITQPGTYAASLTLQTDTPYTVPAVPVSLTVTPPSTWGKVLGTVYGTAKDGSVAPLAGATVAIDSWASGYTLKTAVDGTYALWLDARNSPLTIIVAKDGYRPQTRTLTLKKGQRVTADFTLKRP